MQQPPKHCHIAPVPPTYIASTPACLLPNYTRQPQMPALVSQQPPLFGAKLAKMTNGVVGGSLLQRSLVELVGHARDLSRISQGLAQFAPPADSVSQRVSPGTTTEDIPDATVFSVAVAAVEARSAEVELLAGMALEALRKDSGASAQAAKVSHDESLQDAAQAVAVEMRSVVAVWATRMEESLQRQLRDGVGHDAELQESNAVQPVTRADKAAEHCPGCFRPKEVLRPVGALPAPPP